MGNKAGPVSLHLQALNFLLIQQVVMPDSKGRLSDSSAQEIHTVKALGRPAPGKEFLKFVESGQNKHMLVG